ncbi:hypothetical protein K470DRAFT_267260 [Piedraia hortae CBS 480.64]|uniref:PAS domain-containing protein n=1 Tax=Piedraia hortae CBS 480.64 TaxID=1314780 RepID=A0A6A7CA58_9PEZI|nr:hypothetical protein K470DRAFT_267260 [Piedraia hortae CBS 480.64]
METTFISIHDLTEEARILYSSDSVVDILGYTPEEIVNRSAWDFFPSSDLANARHVYQHRVATDKAAVLVYCNIRNKQDQWVGCEVVFTIVYDVMIVCTSTYTQGEASQRRAIDAPIIRRMFSSSPNDPRYHMLSHLSPKFQQDSAPELHEPRAALFLNRFTRTLTIMYATTGIQEVLGIPAADVRGRSFYFCIAENCLADAVRCLETAKANCSIAYLRCWFRDPRIDDYSPSVSQTHMSDPPLEIEAVVSCSSDGLVVCLRRARPMLPSVAGRGVFAAPWAEQPILPPFEHRQGFENTRFAPSLGPRSAQTPQQPSLQHQQDFLNAIRQQAVFAWAITGTNGSMASYARSKPLGGAVPPSGISVWENEAKAGGIGAQVDGSNDRKSGDNGRLTPQFFGDPGVGHGSGRSL